VSLKKRYLKSKPICKVTFELPRKAAPGAEYVGLAGEFNGWDPQASPLIRKKNGDFNITLELAPGREYQFRYVIDGENWENDWQADRYVPSEIPGVENSVVAV
jgi:1,4-alpha-glucan branching enzyme